MNFKTFLEQKNIEEEKNVKKMLSLLPKRHRKLLDGYKFTFTPGNVLNGDNQHVGYIHNNKIVVAAPWNYSRGFTTLHEIAHLIWETLMTKELKKEWSETLKKAKKEMEKSDSLKQNDEEIFCMVYATTYSKHPPTTYSNENLQNFIRNKVPN